MKRRLASLILVVVMLPAAGSLALDPPHSSANSVRCRTCHTPHKATGGVILPGVINQEGVVALCQSCHASPGGPAQAFPMTDADQALPGPGLPPDKTASGRSHRWDSGPAGHVEVQLNNDLGSGAMQSGGTYSGRKPKTYIVWIAASGSATTATFEWTDDPATAPPTNTPGVIGPTSTPTNTPLPTSTPTDTPLPTDTPTDTPVPTDTPTITPGGPTDTPTDTPVPTHTPTHTPTDTPTDTPTNTPTNTPTTACAPNGQPCTKNADCCSNNCVNIGGGSKECQP